MKQIETGLAAWLASPLETAGLGPGARIGLVAHLATVDGHGHHILELLNQTGPFQLTRLFAPEHGMWGLEQDMEAVEEATDSLTSLPVISLYGTDAASLEIDPADLTGLDALVVDLQDVGSRYYTFVYTLSYVMEAARKSSLPVIVLDRPNPIGGLRVEGPVLHPSCSSFVGRFPLPVRHGMTVGELAGLFNGPFGIGCDLHVVQMKGWQRSMQFEETGLPWIPPSPNMPTPTTARIYPGGCLVEGTTLSEGRGTTQPFELVGAPWLDGSRFCEALRRENLPGVAFRMARFRPQFQKHAMQTCNGVQVLITDTTTFKPFSTYLVMLREALCTAPDAFAWRSDEYEFETSRPAIELLLGRTDIHPLIEAQAALPEMERLWESELEAFTDLRREFLLY
jgi:uncharacterized protein YbbC (DUF1343 family)